MKYQLKFIIIYIFIQENAFENVCKMSAILSRPQCVKTMNSPCTGIQHSWGMTLKYISKSLSMIMNNNPQLLTLPLRSAISSSTTTSPWPLRTSSRSTGGPVGDGRLRWGWGEVNSCLGIWPNSMICFSRAQRWLRSTVLKKRGIYIKDIPGGKFQRILPLYMTKY